MPQKSCVEFVKPLSRSLLEAIDDFIKSVDLRFMRPEIQEDGPYTLLLQDQCEAV